MESKLQLSPNLRLIYIDENNYQNGELISVVCYFNFFGQEGEVYISLDKLVGEYPSYGMTEISSELSDSFNDILDNYDNWKKITEEVRKFVKLWTSENVDC